MVNNIYSLMDDDYDIPNGWVELYNSADTDVNLKGWYLTNVIKTLKKWEIKDDITILPNGFVVIYLDEEDRGSHANFKFDIDGDGLYLVRPDGVTVEDNVSLKKKDIKPDCSYGRETDGSATWGWFNIATPMGSNIDATFLSDIKDAPSVAFSAPAGVYKQAKKIELSVEISEFQNYIYYTIDGTEPTQKSFKYIDPIVLDTTTVIKAKVIKDGYASLSTVNSYIITDRSFDLPIISISLNPKYLWDDSVGIYTIGKTGVYDSGSDTIANYRTNRHRPVFFEYFEQSKRVVAQHAEIRMAGGYTRINPQKSLIVYAKKKYGKKQFVCEFFKGKPSKNKGGYESLLIRNGGNFFDNGIPHDAIVQHFSAKKVDLDYQAYQPAIIFLNGAYFGIENLRERSNEDNILSNYDTDDIDFYENYELKVGTSDAYESLCTMLESGCEFEEIEDAIDVNECLNYLSLEAFSGNYDWPSNNHVFWRTHKNGKFRWLLKDMDGGFSYFGNDEDNGVYLNPFNFLARKEPYFYFGNSENSVMLFNNLNKEDHFRRLYIERIALQLGDIFHKDEIYHVIDSLLSFTENEIPYHFERWGLSYSLREYSIDRIPLWVENRNQLVYQMLSRFYDLGEPVPVSVNSSLSKEEASGFLSINEYPIYIYMFDGSWFSSDSMFLRAKKEVKDVQFCRWEITHINENDIYTQDYEYSPEFMLHINPDNKRILVKALYGVFTSDINFSTNIQLSTYPNPVKETLNVILPEVMNTEVVIYDVSGRKLFSGKFNDKVIHINVSNLENGNYVLNLIANQQSCSTMFIVNR